MLIKAADDRQPDIDVLTGLLGRPDLTVPTRRQIDEELRRVRAGVRGEAVIDFCRDRAGLFGDRILCMDCQHQARRGQV